MLAVALGVTGGVQAFSRASSFAAEATLTDAEVAARGIAADPDAKILIRVLIDAYSGDYVDLSAAVEVPDLPGQRRR